MLPNYLDLKTIYIIVHIFGAIIGAGGAFVSDGVFFTTIKDGRIDTKEFEFIELGSKFVRAGLLILFISGMLLVTTDPIKYINSTKLLAKITIVAVITVNGLIFHLVHIPKLRKLLGVELAQSDEFKRSSSGLVASGAISLFSWILTVVLGSLSSLPFSYVELMLGYTVIMVFAVLGALITKKRIFRVMPQIET